MANSGHLIHFPMLVVAGLLMIQQTDGPQEDVPELAVLNHYLGNWSSEFSIDSDGSASDEERKSFTGKVAAKWTVGGRFLDQTGTYQLGSESPPLVIKTLMTFDVNDQKYRYYFFDSSGERRESAGTWDADKKTMTSMMRRPNGEEMITTADFSVPGVESWKIVIKNAKNDRTTTIKGINKRLER